MSIRPRPILLVALTALSLALAACAPEPAVSDPPIGTPPPSPWTAPPPAASVEVRDGVVGLSATLGAFDTREIDAPAGQGFTINFAAGDGDHRLVLWAEGASDPRWSGPDTHGYGMTTLALPALPAGRYTLSCAGHPGERLVLVVR